MEHDVVPERDRCFPLWCDVQLLESNRDIRLQNLHPPSYGVVAAVCRMSEQVDWHRKLTGVHWWLCRTDSSWTSLLANSVDPKLCICPNLSQNIFFLSWCITLTQSDSHLDIFPSHPVSLSLTPPVPSKPSLFPATLLTGPAPLVLQCISWLLTFVYINMYNRQFLLLADRLSYRYHSSPALFGIGIVCYMTLACVYLDFCLLSTVVGYQLVSLSSKSTFPCLFSYIIDITRSKVLWFKKYNHALESTSCKWSTQPSGSSITHSHTKCFQHASRCE